MENPNLTEGDTLPNKVEINLNVLRALMLDRIGGEVDSTNIVLTLGGPGHQIVTEEHRVAGGRAASVGAL
jgi:hypothetical protein